MTMALVALASTLVILASLFLDALPDRGAQQRALHKAVAEALAVQLAEMLHRDDARAIEKAMAAIVARTEGLRSVGVRRADGTLLLDTGVHARHWRNDSDDRSRPEQVSVPLNAQGGRWGRVELGFVPDDTHPVLAFFNEPLVQMLLFMGFAGWLVFGLYMRRALQHLDPSAVVPERVQGAFDAMAEGVVVLDTRGRVMLSNKAFRQLSPQLAEVLTGSTLSTLPWLAPGLPADPAQHPWMRAMAERSANAGLAVEAGEAGDKRQLLLSAAPISDVGGAVRGCIVTVADMSELHRANEALVDAMRELAASKQQVEQNNRELERLAARDALTGALNRRAFLKAFDAVQAEAQRTGGNITCLMVDIDHFKRINDSHGHGVGDRVIQEVARKLQDSIRGTDLLCRWGGEEFCVVVSGLPAAEAVDFAERVRMRIERECGAAVREVPGLRVTASIGVDRWAGADDALSALVERADQALYRAKRGGRNRVAGGAELVAPAPGSEGRAEHTDVPSGCLNAAGWEQALVSLRETARAQDRVLGCVMFGLDDAAGLAERHGAQAPLQATLALADWVRDSAPSSGAVARLDERRVALMMPGMGIEDCQALGEHLRARAEAELATVFGAAPRSVTISVGLDVLPAMAPGAGMLGERAEQAMNRVRRAGGNGLALFSHLRAVGVSAANGEGAP
jgi:diguanylate cyclase (GGDEF)-like protein/PAS domain S-box-containing protein